MNVIEVFMSLTEEEQLDVLFYLQKRRTSDRQIPDVLPRKDKATYCLYDFIIQEEESKGVKT